MRRSGRCARIVDTRLIESNQGRPSAQWPFTQPTAGTFSTDAPAGSSDARRPNAQILASVESLDTTALIIWVSIAKPREVRSGTALAVEALKGD